MQARTLAGGFSLLVPEPMPDPAADDGSPLLTREELRALESKIHDTLCASVDDNGDSPCGHLRIETDMLIDSHDAALDRITELEAEVERLQHMVQDWTERE